MWFGRLERPQKSLGKKTGGIGNQRENGDHPNHSIVKIGQNTEKSPGDQKRLAVTYSTANFLFFFLINLSYLPTPPLGQDMTQGQFLNGV